MRCLRSILGITWRDKVTNEEVLKTAGLSSITALLKQRRLRWLGHVQRMEPSRLPRKILLSEIAFAKRPIGRPLLRYRDGAKRDMLSFGIEFTNWEDLAEDRNVWRKFLAGGLAAHDEAWFRELTNKRTTRRERVSNTLSPRASQHLNICALCDRICRSRLGLISHERKCRAAIPITDTS